MYNILICDDETIICDGINEIVYEFNDFRSFIANSGEQALSILKTNRIDGIILDIHMPIINGLKLLRILREELNSDAVVFILSGHDQFEYAQESIRYGCDEYILKPVDPETLRLMLKKMRKKMQLLQAAKSKLENLHNQIDHIIPIIRERTFSDLINGTVNETDISDINKFTKIDFGTKYFKIAVIQASICPEIHNAQENQLRLYAIKEFVEQAVNTLTYAYVFSVSTELIAVLIGYNTENENAGLIEFFSILDEQATENYSVILRTGIGEGVDSILNIRTSYSQALDALSYLKRQKYSKTIQYKDLQQNNNDIDLINYLNSYNILSLITLNNIEKAIETFRRAMSELIDKKYCLNLETNRLYCNSIIVASLKLIASIDGEIEPFMNSIEQNPLTTISNLHTLSALSEYTIEILTQIDKYLDRNVKKRDKKIIEDAKKKILNSYHEPITVGSIAESLGLSKNYFGQLFKAHSSTSVNEYINFVRIEKAKELLKDPSKKVFEVAYEVGFNDNYYFSSVFKKIVGLSPKDFQNYGQI